MSPKQPITTLPYLQCDVLSAEVSVSLHHASVVHATTLTMHDWMVSDVLSYRVQYWSERERFSAVANVDRDRDEDVHGYEKEIWKVK